jgi:methanol--5-hydroxybenzimidazolylcobamide Co-methyltransferase
MRRRVFSELAFNEGTIGFGVARFPIHRNGVTIGDGAVIPEIKFTLPPMSVEESTLGEIQLQYTEMVNGVCRRAVELGQKSIVVEFELLPPMTSNPVWGETITNLLRTHLEEFRAKDGLKFLLRITPVDTRDSHRPPVRRTGDELQHVLDSFRRCALAGGDLLSIESTGGKEVTDVAVMGADIRGMIFGCGILAPLDMEFLWEHICAIADETKTIPAGDTACGIGNTAMILADGHFIPKVFAALVRTLTAVRSIVAYEAGAVGPGKDCAYENAFIKAITGLPMSMEGKSSACAHFSSLGNIAAVYADLWSNEAVQNVRLLSGPAPTVSMEQLIYDCRLMNAALTGNQAHMLRQWFVESDASLDPQAYVLKPEIVVRVARALIGKTDSYDRSVAVARETLECLQTGVASKALVLDDREQKWLDRIHAALDELPAEREQFVAEEQTRWKEYVDYEQYGLAETFA